MKHVRYECKHGTVVRQCRCPSSTKNIRVVECPADCPGEKVKDNG